MTREEVYDLCTEKIVESKIPSYRHIDGCRLVKAEDDVVWVSKTLLPPEAIDAIIDCAVEEAVKRIKGR